MRTVKFKEIGTRLRNVREFLKMRLEDVYNETGISRSYVSEFERGYRLPTVRYLKYLHDKHGIKIDYIFGSSGRMKREHEIDTLTLDFDRYQQDVDELLYFMHKLPTVMHSVLGNFMQYKMENKKFISEHFPPNKFESGENTESGK